MRFNGPANGNTLIIEFCKELLQALISPDPLPRAAEIVVRRGAYSQSTIKIGLAYAHEIRGHDWDYAGEVGSKSRHHLLGTKDYREGVRAAIETCKPQWPSLDEYCAAGAIS